VFKPQSRTSQNNSRLTTQFKTKPSSISTTISLAMTDQATPQQTNDVSSPSPSVLLPRVTIRFCTQCKWMLRAAYVSPNNLPPLMDWPTTLTLHLNNNNMPSLSKPQLDTNSPSKKKVRPRTAIHLLHCARRSRSAAGDGGCLCRGDCHWQQ